MLGFKTIRTTLINLNTTVTNSLKASQKVLSTQDAVHKTAVTTTGGMLGVKGAVDIAEDLICQDYVCLTIDCLGVCADTLTVATSFLPGLNVTSVVTIPISTSCKFFRWCCTRSFLKIGCKR